MEPIYGPAGSLLGYRQRLGRGFLNPSDQDYRWPETSPEAWDERWFLRDDGAVDDVMSPEEAAPPVTLNDPRKRQFQARPLVS